jgi:LemA protein
MGKVVLVVVVVVLAVLGGALMMGIGTYNGLVTLAQAVDAQWAQVENVYQRRADLVPNLVATVQGAANFEQSTLTAVTEARASVGKVQVSGKDLVNNPQAFAQWQQAQQGLSSALSRLLVVAENYPDLKASASFRDLQAQLEGTENRITVARNRYIDAVRTFNVTVRSFPTNLTAMLFKFKEKAQFTVENEAEIARPPTVDFGTSPAPAAVGR